MSCVMGEAMCKIVSLLPEVLQSSSFLTPAHVYYVTNRMAESSNLL